MIFGISDEETDSRGMPLILWTLERGSDNLGREGGLDEVIEQDVAFLYFFGIHYPSLLLFLSAWSNPQPQ